jgi:hypothetical protein
LKLTCFHFLVLDILAKPVFCFFHAYSLRRVAYAGYGLSSGKASIGAGNAVNGAGYGGGMGYTNGAGTGVAGNGAGYAGNNTQAAAAPNTAAGTTGARV